MKPKPLKNKPIYLIEGIPTKAEKDIKSAVEWLNKRNIVLEKKIKLLITDNCGSDFHLEQQLMILIDTYKNLIDRNLKEAFEDITK